MSKSWNDTDTDLFHANGNFSDQFCSLTFTLSNLYFVGCAYNQKWDNVWISCSTAKHWGIPFALSSLPLLVRTVQSIKRYVDSGLYTHLINVRVQILASDNLSTLTNNCAKSNRVENMHLIYCITYFSIYGGIIVSH